MAAAALDNLNPVVRERENVRRREEVPGLVSLASGAGPGTSAEDERELIDSIEVFEHIRDIADPEHPYSLEQLGVVTHGNVKVRFAHHTTTRFSYLFLSVRGWCVWPRDADVRKKRN